MMHNRLTIINALWPGFILFILAAGTAAEETGQLASLNGRYSELLQKMACPQDAGQYGEFSEYGYWAGESWCGYSAKTGNGGMAGYLVWVNPDWYLWRKRKESNRSSALPYIPGHEKNNKADKPASRDCRPVHLGIVTVTGGC